MELTADLVSRLRDALRAAEFTYAGVAALLGPTAHAALSRNETTPGIRATGGGTPLETLTRLWPLQTSVAVAEAEAALPGLVDPLCVAGLLERSVASVRARVDVRPYASDERDWWVVSDLTPGLDGSPNRVSGDHVLGISPASTSLAQLTVRHPVVSALDLGTGCGVQSLHLTQHAASVVATDVNRRALAMTRLNAALNEVSIDVRDGNLFDPVRGEQFDLLVTNPPFVVSPGTGELLVYRDSGLPGDELVRRVVTSAPAHLAPGGTAHVLANWVHVEGESWQERVEHWLAPVDGRSCDGWVVQREVADPAQYVELWLRDAGHDRSPDYTRRYDAWTGWFADQGITGIGFGWLNLRRTDRALPSARVEEWPFEVEQPLGAEVDDHFARVDLLSGMTDEAVLATAWQVRADVRQESFGAPGAEDPETIVLRQQRGMRRARQVDTVQAALVGASDGELTAAQIFAAVDHLLGARQPRSTAEQASTVRALVADGFLLPLP